MTNATLQRPEIAKAVNPAPEDVSRKTAGIGLILFGLFLCTVLASQCQNHNLQDQCLTLVKNAQFACKENFLTGLLANPNLYCAVGFAILLERLYPAKPQQSFFSNQSLSDLLWVAPNLFFFSTVWLMYIALAHAFYNQYLGFLTIHAVDGWPWFARFVLALTVMDFVAWLSHLARHKVPFFWGFHSVHHAQRNLNFFTEYRSHIMDELLKYTLEALPLFMLEQSFVQIATINQLRYWHSAFYHANVKSNHGFLRYFIVTPQSHRVHHSIEPQHRDTNFGSSFSIWDQIFGTQCKDYDAYPDTGIEDPFFPVDQSQSLKNSLKTFFAQFFYPLKLPSFKK